MTRIADLNESDYGFSTSVSLKHFKSVYFSKGSKIVRAYCALVCVYEIRH